MSARLSIIPLLISPMKRALRETALARNLARSGKVNEAYWDRDAIVILRAFLDDPDTVSALADALYIQFGTIVEMDGLTRDAWLREARTLLKPLTPEPFGAVFTRNVE